jgi:hypothetical protein
MDTSATDTAARPAATDLPALDHAFDSALDAWGHALGQPRDGLADHELRALCAATVRARVGVRTPDDLAEVARLAAGAARVTARPIGEHSDALSVQVLRDGPAFMSDRLNRRVAALLQAHIPAPFVALEALEACNGGVFAREIRG